MKLSVFGINHKTAPIDIREKFFLNSLEQDILLSDLKCDPAVFEAFTASTCNRTEIYLTHAFGAFSASHFLKLISRIKESAYDAKYRPYFYVLHNDEAIEHLLKVVCGLDSLVLGEKQILGQIKRSFERSREKGMFSRYMNLLSALAVRAGKKAHSETQISCGGSSISWAAITTAEQELETLEGKTLLIIGAGKMGELAVDQITQKKFEKLYLINRTQENAEALAKKYGGEAVPFCDIKDIFSAVDVCICAADAPHYILDYSLVEQARARSLKEKTVLIDISMPRNIDPRVALIPKVHLYHIDELNKPIAEALNRRQAAVGEVEEIIAKKLKEFEAKIRKAGVAAGDTLRPAVPVK